MFIFLQAAATTCVVAVKHLALKLPVSANYIEYFLTFISKLTMSSHDFSNKCLFKLFFLAAHCLLIEPQIHWHS